MKSFNFKSILILTIIVVSLASKTTEAKGKGRMNRKHKKNNLAIHGPPKIANLYATLQSAEKDDLKSLCDLGKKTCHKRCKIHRHNYYSEITKALICQCLTEVTQSREDRKSVV